MTEVYFRKEDIRRKQKVYDNTDNAFIDSMFKTPSPYHERDRKKLIIKVGSYACIACSYHGGIVGMLKQTKYVNCRKS